MGAEQHWTSAELLARYRGGDERAADDLFQRYIDRLARLARARLSPRLASRTDPEDIVLSAWRSFFVGARSGRFALRRSGDLWRLLASIAMHKLYRQARRHLAQMRSVGAEQRGPEQPGAEQSWDLFDEERLPLSREPAAEEAIALADELELVLARLDAFGRRVLELRLQGEQLAAIAADTGRSERTVRRTLAQIRVLLAARLGRDDG